MLPGHLTGEKCSYADIFIYTCIKTVQETKGFSILRDACEDHPFKNCENILNICNEISNIPEVIETIGSKFKDYPF